MKLNGETIYNKRHRGWEPFDKITMEIVPRYKTSELSGDEWRTSVAVQFWFKGVMIHSWSTGRMEDAIMCLGAKWSEHTSPIHDGVIEREEECCDQPSCNQPPTVRYLLKRETSHCGHWLDPGETTLQYFRKFCNKHAERGDCGREDADRNYTLIEDSSD